MKLGAILRGVAVALVALASAGCVDTGYREGPRVYRDHYDRGYWRPDYLRRDPRLYRHGGYGRYDRDGRVYHRDRFDGRRPFDRGVAYDRGSRGGDGGARPRIRYRVSS